MMIKTEEAVKSSGIDNSESSKLKHENRDDVSGKSKGVSEEREEPETNTKQLQSNSSSRTNQNGGSHPSPRQVSGYQGYRQQAPARALYHPGMHGSRGPPPSSAPFQPPYYPMGAPHDYRGQLPHHYPHQMPPMPHPSQGGPYPGAHYQPNLTGRPGPPPGYHPGYGAPYPGPPGMGYHGAPPPYPQGGHIPHLMMSSTSDSASIASSKSKKSTKSSRKKRTIDGVHTTKETTPPVAYTFCRTNSNLSSSTTATAPNGPESHTMGDESPYKRERTGEKDARIYDERFIRQNFSNASSSSSVSVGGLSFASFDGPKPDRNDSRGTKVSPKRRKAEHLTVETGSNLKSIFKKKSGAGIDSSKFQQLTMNDSSVSSKSNGNTNGNIFLSISTSPVNAEGVEETPIKSNALKKSTTIAPKTEPAEEEHNCGETSSKKAAREPSTATPSLTIVTGDAAMTDEHMLNKHLRGQSFTPLPHLAESSNSPSNAFQSIGPQLSWSIAGDAPSLEDLAQCSWEETEKDEKKRPGSTTSQLSNTSRGLVISPHNFSLWKDEHETGHPARAEDMKDSDSVRISMLSPHSEIAMAVDGVCGTSTPLPWSFEPSEERENILSGDKKSKQDHIHRNVFASAHKPHATPGAYMWSGQAPPTPVFPGSATPTPHFPGSFVRSPLHCDRREWFGHMTPGSHNHDRVRNLRGRVPHGSHLTPMPLHIPHSMASHHPLTSPMGTGHKSQMWSPHGNMPPSMTSPHGHISNTMDMSQSKRKCVPRKPPIPSKFQGDMETMKSANVPEFTMLVNFPAHMSQKQAINLPEGMRCCVMCGQACPCSSSSKKKGGNSKKTGCGQGDKNPAIIPTQNKGLCTRCDVNVWVVCNSGLEIKWCKGCKNFRPWASFGDKGLATKCLRCRDRQREKYAIQKEEKDKARLLKGTIKTK